MHMEQHSNHSRSNRGNRSSCARGHHASNVSSVDRRARPISTFQLSNLQPAPWRRRNPTLWVGPPCCGQDEDRDKDSQWHGDREGNRGAVLVHAPVACHTAHFAPLVARLVFTTRSSSKHRNRPSQGLLVIGDPPPVRARSRTCESLPPCMAIEPHRARTTRSHRSTPR